MESRRDRLICSNVFIENKDNHNSQMDEKKNKWSFCFENINIAIFAPAKRWWK